VGVLVGLSLTLFVLTIAARYEELADVGRRAVRIGEILGVPINRGIAARLLNIESRRIICDFVRLSGRCCYRNAYASAWPEGASDRLRRIA
jgi:hypothetical protein